jgi:aldehyde:ferredoxin oxidoreductase
MLGSNLACFDMDKIIERYAQCLDVGLDPVSTGNVLGWAISAWSSEQMNLFEPDFSFKDNSKVLPLIEMIAKRVGPGEPLSFGTYALGKACGDESFAYTIRGLECGPYDYRGAYAQSLSDSMGFWFPNYFEIHSRVCTSRYEEWAVLNERIVMGLESYGLSPAIIVPSIIEASRKLRKRIKIIPNSEIKNVKLNVPCKIITAVTGVETSGDDILGLGDRCWRLIYEINRALGFNMLEDVGSRLPEHFYIDPDSNHEKPSIVPFRALIDRYCFLRKQIIAGQGSDLG